MQPHKQHCIQVSYLFFSFQLQDPDDTDAAAQQQQWEKAYQAAMDQPPLPAAVIDEDDTSDEPTPAASPATQELGFERQGLAFVAGYVAFKCRHIRDDLGQLTSSASAPASVPSS